MHNFKKVGINHNIPNNGSDRKKYFLKGASSRLREGFQLKKIQGANWNDCFKFAFVRNPWDRMVSSWSYCKSKTNSSIKFEEFVTQYPFQKVFWDWHTQPQYIHLTDETTGELIVDFVGKLENLKEDLDKIKKILKIDKELRLPVVNKSKHESYKEYYTKELVEIVANIFYEDVNRFGYEFHN